MHKDGLLERRWLMALLATSTALAFMLLHPYRGLVHDARLYTIQALGHWRPELYGADIFLRFGSQDDYTIFSSLHAIAIAWLGIEPAAALLTGIAVLLFLVAYTLLARTCMSKEQAAMALVLLLVIPGYYGSARIFHFIEGFVSPRQLAEALSLLGLAAWIGRRRIIGVALCATAMLVHPIIALPCLLMLPTLDWVLPNWRKFLPLVPPLAVLAGMLAVASALGWLPIAGWQFDTQWYDIVMKRTYLGMENWTNEDWGRVMTVLATLATAAMTLTGRQQSIAWSSLLVVVALMLLSLVGGELLRITLVVQAQPWRAMWLGTCMAILLLVPLYARGWKAGPLMRCALLLIAAAWAAPHGTLALIAPPMAVLAAACTSRIIPRRIATLLLYGSGVTLAISIVHSLAVSWLAWNENLTVQPDLPPLMQKITLFGESGVLPALVIAATAYLVAHFRSPGVIKAITAASVVAVLTIAIPVSRTWAASEYNDELVDAFSEWRAMIPPRSEVLWVDAGQESGAVNTWLLLQRPTFISGTQAPNALFSRPAALEMALRADAVAALLPFSNPFRPEDEPRRRGPFELGPICDSLKVRYIVTSEQLTDARPYPAPANAPPTLRNHGLYICP